MEENGRPQPKLSRKQELAAVTLLEEPTIRAAAQTCGVGETTIYRWLQLDDFRDFYLALRRQLVEQAMGQLQKSCTAAAEALERNLTSDNPGVQVRAAVAIIELSMRGVALGELSERLGRLEDIQLGRPRYPRAIGPVAASRRVVSF
jgi:DNA-binding MurR/RpiR family transcriptional regulator